MADRDPRPYIAVTNELFDHPKFIVLTEKSQLHLIYLWTWCNKQRTDGQVPRVKLMEKGKRVFDQLTRGGWVDRTNDADIFQMHDYLKHQKSRVELEEMARDRAEAGRRGGIRSNHTRNHVKKGVFDASCELCADPSEEPKDTE